LLTPLDQFAFQWVIQGTWLFAERLDAHALKDGIARLLASYPILSGRVVAGRRIEWTGDGIPFIEAVDNTLDVADFNATHVDAIRFGHRFAPGLIRRGRAPLLTLKLTHLREGCVLAICCSHACLDGNGFYTMVRNLSRATAGVAFPPLTFEPRTDGSKPRRRAEVARAALKAGWRRLTELDLLQYALDAPRLLERTFVAHFPPLVLQRCKETLARGSGNAALSTHSALLAHVAACVARLLRLGGGDRFWVSVAVDQRERVGWLGEDFAGNAVSVVMTAPLAAICHREQIAARIHERLLPLLTRQSPELESLARLTAEVVACRLPYTPLVRPSPLSRRRALFYTNSFARFPVYDLDFGCGSRPARPIRAIPHNLGDPILFWPAPPSVGGLELYFSGRLARAVRRLAKDDPWWTELRCFET
jgi:hypothetical protein